MKRFLFSSLFEVLGWKRQDVRRSCWNETFATRENSVKAERRNKVEGVMMGGSSSSKECLNSSSPDLFNNDFVLDSFHPNTTCFRYGLSA